jgi:hypothetical protein
MPEGKVWIIQRCTNILVGASLRYEPWPEYSQPMTYAQMLVALAECERRWPTEEFRGHREVK